MAIVRWRPYRELATLQDEMNSLLESFFGRGVSGEPEPAGVMWGPRVDIRETENGFVVEAELPGLTKEDIKLSVHASTLTLEGEKRVEEKEKGKNWHRQERSFGKFQRVFTLPSVVDPQRISAAFKNGVLTVELPKSEAARPKEIPISIK